MNYRSAGVPGFRGKKNYLHFKKHPSSSSVLIMAPSRPTFVVGKGEHRGFYIGWVNNFVERTVLVMDNGVREERGVPEEVLRPKIVYEKDGKKFIVVVEGFVGHSETPSFGKHTLELRVVPEKPEYEEEARTIAREIAELTGGKAVANYVDIDLDVFDKIRLVQRIEEGIGRWLAEDV